MVENVPASPPTTLFAAVYDISEHPRGRVHFELHITPTPSILERQIKEFNPEIIKSVDLEGIKELPATIDPHSYLQDLAKKYDGFYAQLHIHYHATLPYIVAFHNEKIFNARDLMAKEGFEIKKIVKLERYTPKKPVPTF